MIPSFSITLWRVLPVLVIMLLLAACKDRVGSTAGFVLEGTISGMPDSTWLLLRYANAERPFDSTKSIRGRFRFTGAIPDSLRAAQAILHTRDHEHYKFLWLENAHMIFAGEMGKFRMAKVTGSATEEDAYGLQMSVYPVVHEADSLRKIFYNMPGEADRDASGLEERIRSLEKEKDRLEIAFVREHPESLESVYILSVYTSTWGRKITSDLFEPLSEANKKSGYGRSVLSFLELNKDLDVGDNVVDVDQPNVHGERKKLSDVKAKYVLLEFWASWCGPCRRENPELVKTYKIYKSRGFEVYAVSLDDERDRWVKAIETDSLPWINVSELKGDQNTAVLTYGIPGIPDNFLIDSTGTIVARNLRGDELRDRLKELMPEASR